MSEREVGGKAREGWQEGDVTSEGVVGWVRERRGGTRIVTCSSAAKTIYSAATTNWVAIATENGW